MAISPIKEIIADIKAGKMAILVDEEERENEGSSGSGYLNRRPGEPQSRGSPWGRRQPV